MEPISTINSFRRTSLCIICDNCSSSTSGAVN